MSSIPMSAQSELSQFLDAHPATCSTAEIKVQRIFLNNSDPALYLTWRIEIQSCFEPKWLLILAKGLTWNTLVLPDTPKEFLVCDTCPCNLLSLRECSCAVHTRQSWHFSLIVACGVPSVSMLFAQCRITSCGVASSPSTWWLVLPLPLPLLFSLALPRTSQLCQLGWKLCGYECIPAVGRYLCCPSLHSVGCSSLVSCRII